jgi:hypothetical protein
MGVLLPIASYAQGREGGLILGGAARVSIVPPFPTGMGGFYDRLAKFTGVHDPIYARALVCATGSTQIAVVATDLINMSRNVVDAARAGIESKTGIPAENILIAAAHDHSAPSGYQSDRLLMDQYDQRLFDFMTGKIIEVVEEAHKNLRPALIGYRSGCLEGITRNRQQNNEEVIDPEVGVLKVWEPGTRKVVATLFNFTGHPVILGSLNLEISGEYPGCAERTVEEVLGGVALFLQGACGDVTVKRKGDPYLEVERLGHILAGEVIKTAEMITGATDTSLRSSWREVEVGSRVLPPVEEARTTFEQAKQALAEAESKGIKGKALARLERAADTSGTTLKVAKAAKERPEDYKAATHASVHLLQLGPALLVGIPGEPFVEYALELKQRVRQETRHPLMVAGYSNGYIGYIITDRAKSTGGYENAISRVDENAGRVLVEAAMNLVGENFN